MYKRKTARTSIEDIRAVFRRNPLKKGEICEAAPIPEVHPLSFFVLI